MAKRLPPLRLGEKVIHNIMGDKWVVVGFSGGGYNLEPDKNKKWGMLKAVPRKNLTPVSEVKEQAEMKDRVKIKRPENLTAKEIYAALRVQGIRPENIVIENDIVEVWFIYHPSDKDYSSEWEQALKSASAAKASTVTPEYELELHRELIGEFRKFSETEIAPLLEKSREEHQKAIAELQDVMAKALAELNDWKEGDSQSCVKAIWRAQSLLQAGLNKK